MERKVVSEFKGIIGETAITNENMYYLISYVMDILEQKFNFKEQEFLNDFINCLEYIKKKNTIEWDVLKSDIKIAVDNNYDLEMIEFDYYGSTDLFEELNKNIKDGKYRIEIKSTKIYNDFEKLLKDKVEMKKIKKDVFDNMKEFYDSEYVGRKDILYVVYNLLEEIKKRMIKNIYFDSFDNFGKILELKKEIFDKEFEITDKFFYDYDEMCLLIDLLEEKDFLNKLIEKEEETRKMDAIILFGFKLENILNIAISLI